MTHVNISNDADHKVFVFIRDQLAGAEAFVRENVDEQGLLRFGNKYDTDGAKLTVSLRQYWPPRLTPEGVLVGSVDLFANDLVLEEPPAESARKSASARPTTHEDLLDIYNTRAREHHCGFLLAGELDEAAKVLINGEPALGQDKFKLKMGSPLLPGYIELVWSSCELTRFGCGVTFYYNPNSDRPPREVIEVAFIELLDGAVPTGKP
jgi:hypothetical protein